MTDQDEMVNLLAVDDLGWCEECRWDDRRRKLVRPVE